MNARPVLDACCGSRMFWFDRADDRAVFGDIRHERHELADKSSAGGVDWKVARIRQIILFDDPTKPTPSQLRHVSGNQTRISS